MVCRGAWPHGAKWVLRSFQPTAESAIRVCRFPAAETGQPQMRWWDDRAPDPPGVGWALAVAGGRWVAVQPTIATAAASDPRATASGVA